MIYIFKGCSKSCNACGKVCDEACKACGQCCEPCSKVLDRPLGWYVFFDIFMNLLMVLFGVLGIGDAKIDDCENPVKMFIFVNFALALVNVWFSFHMQYKLVEGLSDVDAAQITPKEVMNRAGHIMLYDIGFCLYVFVFCFCMAWNCMGSGWAGSCNTQTAWPGLAALMGILFCVLTIIMMMWYWLMLCLEDCCCPQSSKRGGGYMVGAILGNPGKYQPRFPPPSQPHPPPQAQMYGQPVQGQPVYAQPVAQPAYAQQGGQPSAPPQEQKPSKAQQAMGMGLQGVGGMIQGLGAKLQGKPKPSKGSGLERE